MFNSSLAQRDLKVLWHPCTQMKDHEVLPMIPIKSAQGVWLYDYEGRRYLDAISSWWVNLFGHANPKINAAIKAQLDQLEQVIFAGFSHEGAVVLAERLTQLTGLDRCFYADNGSSAVEVALKMSFQYWQNIGQVKKIKFAHLENGYHGETLGALAVGDLGLYKKTFAPLLPEVVKIPVPHASNREPSESATQHATRIFEQANKILAAQQNEICALIVEPLVQCAGHMNIYDPLYLKLLRKACDRYHIHLIADEIAVGFGRTGKMFACEHAEITPDFMCLSKGLTGGYLPLSCVLTRESIYQAFYDTYESGKGFLHSHSYTGNPLAVSAALATLDIFVEENIIEKNLHLSAHLEKELAPLCDHPHISNSRQLGLIAAFDVVNTKGHPYPSNERRGLQIYQYAIAHEMLIRPIDNTVYFMPPYVITKDEISLLVSVAAAAINDK
ncbi:MAG TPA: adenosylmethionine--8-amino-7-oxononanoate transaminase [Gammaproteobacteria bacterium]|nr:adenosylmethionine--8-amino-7-oxononanoate transaminase [Gammaproteobacteria bacterium]